MNRRLEPLYDVFLSHAHVDGVVAESVARRFRDAGFGVFTTRDMSPGDEYNQKTRYALRECVAYVALLTKAYLHHANLAFEIGAATGADLPVFLLLDQVAVSEVPDFLAQFRRAPLAALPEIISAIRQLRQPFSDNLRQALVTAYQRTTVPVDRLLSEPAAANQLAHEFQRTAAKEVPVKTLLTQLVRLRKQGQLPRLQPAKTMQS